MDKDLAMFDHHVHTSQTVSIHGYWVDRSKLCCYGDSSVIFTNDQCRIPQTGGTIPKGWGSNLLFLANFLKKLHENKEIEIGKVC